MTSEIRYIHTLHKQLKGCKNEKIVLDIGDNYFYISSSITNQLFRYVHFIR